MAAIGDKLLVGALPIHQHLLIRLTPYRQRLHRQLQLLRLMTLGRSQRSQLIQQLQQPTRGYLQEHQLLQLLLVMILGPPLLQLQLLLPMMLGQLRQLLLPLQLQQSVILGQPPLQPLRR